MNASTTTKPPGLTWPEFLARARSVGVSQEAARTLWDARPALDAAKADAALLGALRPELACKMTLVAD